MKTIIFHTTVRNEITLNLSARYKNRLENRVACPIIDAETIRAIVMP